MGCCIENVSILLFKPCCSEPGVLIHHSLVGAQLKQSNIQFVMAGYYPAYAQGPVYLGPQDVSEMERLEFYPRPAYHPHTGCGIRRHSSQLQIDAEMFPTAPAGPRMLLQDGSFAASSPLSPYDEMTLTGATHIVGEHTAAYPQGDSSAMVRVEPPAYR